MIYKCKILVHKELQQRVTFPVGEGALCCNPLMGQKILA